jgi:hypothetical protein
MFNHGSRAKSTARTRRRAERLLRRRLRSLTLKRRWARERLTDLRA